MDLRICPNDNGVTVEWSEKITRKDRPYDYDYKSHSVAFVTGENMDKLKDFVMEKVMELIAEKTGKSEEENEPIGHSESKEVY